MNRLAQILQTKRAELVEAMAATPLAALESRLAASPPPRGFLAALERAQPGPALIAEAKKASPSRGLIRPDFEVVSVVRAYESAGAHALSVLTDATFFQGSNDNLVRAREATRLPVLRKDFTLEPYQIVESRVLGADAVLLIVAALSEPALVEMHALGRSLGMDVLVEVHDEDEAEIALRHGFPLIGVNNRDLSTFATDPGTSSALVPRLARHAFVVSESALESAEDVTRARASGARAVLIGTAFCAAPDIEPKVREVMGW
ncbi:MAG: indole-3-glycerol phosphate synthase TrpC [Fimbriimonadaceae bacterium]|nr:indole-3-glycerol phosphate synthase TrpC [Fimbriimonadaceae bacterium]